MAFTLTSSDEKFIKNAENISLSLDKLNLKLEDFTTLTNKNAVQFLIKKHHFSGYPVIFQENFSSLSTLKQALTNLKVGRSDSYKEVYEFTFGNKFGRGEVLIFFILNQATLSGTSESNDINLSGRKLEVKAVKIKEYYEGSTRMEVINDFRLGGTINCSTEISQMINLYEKAVKDKKVFVIKNPRGADKKVEKPQDYRNGMGSVVFEFLKQEYPNEYKSIEQSYRIKAAQYFTSKLPIFFNNKENDFNYGTIINDGNIEASDIFMYRFIGQGRTIAPMIRIK